MGEAQVLDDRTSRGNNGKEFWRGGGIGGWRWSRQRSSFFDDDLFSPAVAAPLKATARTIADRDAHTSSEACTTRPYKDGAFLSRLLQCQSRETSSV